MTVGAARFRFGSWHDPDVAYLVPLSTATTLVPETLGPLRTRLRDRGFVSTITAALGPAERDALLSNGFEMREELRLLRHDLGARLPTRPSRSDLRTRRGRRRDIPALLTLDASAFEPFWRLDNNGLHEALTATAVSRLRVTGSPEITAYCVAGRSQHLGYLQRLAVAPRSQRNGVGGMLVADALHWLRAKGARSALVNTQIHNDGALALYERSGFEEQADRLAVLHCQL